MNKVLSNFMKNLLQFAIYFFVVYLCINFTPLKYVDKKLLNTMAITGLFLTATYIMACYLSKVKHIQNFIKKTKELKCESINNFYRTFGIIKKFEAEELSGDNFKIEVERQIKKSKRIYFRFLTGYTIFFGEKKAFIWNTLKNLSPEEIKIKDIRIQLLNRTSPYFNHRVNKIVLLLEKGDPQNRISFNEFLQRCKDIESEFAKLIGADRIAFYQRKYLWRLFIFDDVIFTSFYYDDVNFAEGHLLPVYSFHKERNEALFETILEEFNSLYRPLWKSNLSTEKTSAIH